MFEPYYQDDWVTIYHGDCLEIMPELPKVDLVLTDPPFTFGLGSSISNTKLSNWNDLLNGAHFFKEVFKEIKKSTKTNFGCWVFNSWRSLPCLIKALCMADLKIESLLIWYKDWIGPGGPKGLRPSYEVVALICQGEWGLQNRNIRDVQTFPWASYKPNHPAEKPLKLINWLISESNNPNLILDPFLGSGTTCLAAKQLNRKSIGIEIEEKYCEIAAKRCSQEVLDFS